jgi:hypothetical protein
MSFPFGEVMWTWEFAYDSSDRAVKVAAYRGQGVPDDGDRARAVHIDIDQEGGGSFGLYLSREQARDLARFLLLITEAQ